MSAKRSNSMRGLYESVRSSVSGKRNSHTSLNSQGSQQNPYKKYFADSGAQTIFPGHSPLLYCKPTRKLSSEGGVLEPKESRAQTAGARASTLGGFVSERSGHDHDSVRSRAGTDRNMSSGGESGHNGTDGNTDIDIGHCCLGLQVPIDSEKSHILEELSYEELSKLAYMFNYQDHRTVEKKRC